jgi:phage terminase small subunit
MMLTAKQQRFVDEYLIDLNATQAAIRAGYSAKTAYSIGDENLKKPEIAAAVQKAMDSRAARTGITADRVLAELAKIGFADIRKAIRWYSQTNIASVDDDDAEALIEEGAVRFAVANQVELISSDEIDDATAAAISEIGQTSTGALKVKLHDKRAALVDIGKHLGMFRERVEHTGKDGGPIEIDQKVKEDADVVASAIACLAQRARAAGVAGETQH